MKIPSLILSALALTLLNGCFTGVESTPKITGREVKRQNIVDSPERHILDSVTNTPPARWIVGKRFYVSDDRVGLAAWRIEPRDSLAGRYAVLTSTEKVPTLTGSDEIQLNFTLEGIPGSIIELRTGVSPATWRTLAAYTIPHTVDMDIVGAVAEKIVGKTFYILPARRIASDGNDTLGRRYQPVRIISVEPANEATPIRVLFTDNEGYTASVLMTLGDETTSRRNFETIFAIDDPRPRYKTITDEIWDLITRGRVKTGMTPEECRLALGSPDNYRRIPTTAGMAERWSYTNGAYLYFEDGILSAYRL